MPSLSQLCATTGLPFLAWLSLLPLILYLNIGVHGATLREPQLWGNEPNAFRPSSQAPPPPSAAMLQALQYIQSLSKRTLHDPVINIDKPDVPEDDLEDLERVRAMLQLATPARTSSGMRDSRGEHRGEEDEGDGEEEKEDDKAQQWIQAVLSTLQQTEDQMSPQKTPHRESTHSLKSSHPLLTLSPAVEAKQEQEQWTGPGDYGRSLFDNQGVRRHHRKFPLLFEDKHGQDQPLKRTNENAEEQYTPQKLATLQSVFEELSRMPNSELKSDSKQQNTEDSEEGEESDRYREKKMVFDDILGDDEELMPLEERTEQVEEETHRREYNGGFGRGRDAQEQEDNVEDREDKRSSQLDLLETTKEKEDPDDLSRLVDYYLMKVLEKEQEQKRDQGKETEEKDSEDQEEEDEEDEEDSDREEERREDEEEESEERDKRRASLPQYTVDPQSLYQLIQISKKLQIPPEDILDLLESEGNRKLGKSWQRKPTQSKIPSLRYPGLYSTRKSPGTAPVYQRPLLQTSAPQMSSITQDILRILGLANMAKPNDKPLLRLNQYKSAPLALNYYMSERELPDYALSDTSRDQREADYDDTLGEDELASLLAAEMLAQRPRRSTQGVHDYFDQSVQSMPENRQSEQEETGESENDEETLLRILKYLNPESEDADETDINGKTVSGM
ncbi:secretogranin-2 [Astyanax mexicanus]|uniref:secretogranin-2 n=1 Tax=Astyanax mexicanus TaxID=7994 RepID=UPI0020CB56B9|nr:secretogranin-2 [Astyanax mexicanus]